MKMYKPTIGLEIHAELNTKTKMFCNSKNDPDEVRPNVNICPVCMGHPGTLPVINKQAVKSVLKVGLALNGTISSFTEFDRKNYFYPDIPKGYQISQYKYPLVAGGELSGIKITRVHLEEDTATSQHPEKSTDLGASEQFSLVNYNRAGVPLMELVTEPVIHSAEEASSFAKEFQLLLRYLGVAEANMEKGEMRVEANISISDTDTFGTKTEIKNLNSFKVVEKAIAYEIKRQTEILEKGEKVVQETRGWDDVKSVTYSQRLKESSHDYRYFPDPDLPKLDISKVPEFSVEILKKELPELPWQRRARYQKLGEGSQFKMNPDYVEMFIADERFGSLFDETLLLQNGAYNMIANFINTDIAGLVSKHGDTGLKNITPKGLEAVVINYTGGSLSSRGAKDAIEEVFTKGGDLTEVSKKYFQKSDDGELTKIAQSLIAENPKVVEDYRAGKAASLQFLVGQGMKATKGSANPAKLRTIIESLIK
ncbi:MAG: Asp-tRNA(Asn)/Glu-tRNA(Gln) amidotransferase subunit GatB [Candidatus Taylorbacteria bacterium]|nr:Asp-tRNA(Asn)/Glu-tRNA(Gln) amidotransferase subunit GatB [Candidatus Taylorbacteria bacterium]